MKENIGTPLLAFDDEQYQADKRFEASAKTVQIIAMVEALQDKITRLANEEAKRVVDATTTDPTHPVGQLMTKMKQLTITYHTLDARLSDLHQGQ